MIDIESERLVTLRESPKHIPGRPHLSCVYRWMHRRQSPLETILIGGRRFTSLEAIHRFIAGCNSGERITPTVLNKKRQAEIAAADAELDRAGI